MDQQAATPQLPPLRSRTVLFMVLAGLCAVLALSLGTVLLTAASQPEPVPTQTNYQPSKFGSGGNIVVGDPAEVVVEYYYDYHCPACRQFDIDVIDRLRRMQSRGDIQIAYHPLALLDDRSLGREYSTRAAGAAYCVATKSPTAFPEFHRLMLAMQPEPNTFGLRNDVIYSMAEQAGGADTIKPCIAADYLEPYAKQMTQRAIEDELGDVPALFLDGERLNAPGRTASEMEALVEQEVARKAGPAATNSPSPNGSTGPSQRN